MNSHNPFNTGGCPGGIGDFRSADTLVDRLIGDAYHVVKEVYLKLGQLEYFYTFLNKYGVIAPVESETQLKGLPVSTVKFARLYTKTAGTASTYYYLDYLYLEGDLTGIRPNVTNPTGSWKVVGSSGSAGSLNTVWKYEVATDTNTVTLPEDVPVKVIQAVYLNSGRLYPTDDYLFDEDTRVVTFADTLVAGEDKLMFVLGLSNPEDDMDIFSILSAKDAASRIGTSNGTTVQDYLDGLSLEVDPTLRNDLKSTSVTASGTSRIGHHFQKLDSTLKVFLDKVIYYSSPSFGFASLKECCDYAIANGISTVMLPKGEFTVDTPIQLSGSFKIEGAGIGETIIKQPASAADSVFVHLLNSPSDSVGYSGFTLQTEKPYSASNMGIQIDSRPQLNGTEVANRTRYRGYIRDVEITGSYTRSDGISFGACIDLISTGWIDMERLRLSGSSVAGSQYNMQGVGILQRGDGKPVETRIMGLRGYNFEYGYLCPEYTEGVYFTDSLVVNSKWGVVVSPVAEWVIGTLGQTGCYQFNVDQFHANVSMGGVFLSGAKYCTVSNSMFILDDHSQSSSVLGVHLRNGYGCSVKNIQEVFYNVDGTTGITRQGVLLNGITDSVCSAIFARTESTAYENISHVVRLVNGSLRNRLDKVSGINADVGISIATGCGNNAGSSYRFQNVTTAIDDQAGDFNRGNADSRYITFTPTAGANSYTVTLTPREYFSRRPNGVSANITSPSTLSFPVDVFYDYANSTATLVTLIVKPTQSGSTLPAVQFGLSVNMKD